MVGFREDARKMSDVLGITLTRKKMADGSNLESAMFPERQMDEYLPRLIRAGVRVAICDDKKFDVQVEKTQADEETESRSFHR